MDFLNLINIGGIVMKIIIIGCTHAGTAAAINIAKLYDNNEIIIYERNDNISFLSWRKR